MAEILLVEDEAALRETAVIALRRAGHQVDAVAAVRPAKERLQNRMYDLVAADLRLPDGDALDILREMRDLELDTAAIVMSAYGSVSTAVDAMRMGAFDFLEKPYSVERLTASVYRALEHRRMRAELRRRNAPRGLEEVIVGASEAIAGVRDLVGKAKEASSVLVTGETGVGKDVVARAIHDVLQPDTPLVVVNCGALPETLIESELFGHVRGAFTGAATSRPGLIAEADGGVLFLDEIGEIPLQLQARLLHFLERGEIRAVGADHTTQARCQIIAATNRDLAKDVAAGTFRQDLRYRLDVFRIHVPPLRERVADVEPLAAHLLQRIAGRMPRPTPGITPAALEVLKNHSWPGNVRELGHTLERALLLSRADPLPASLIEACLDEPVDSGSSAKGYGEETRDPTDLGSWPTLESIEREHIFKTLERCDNDRTKTAKLLGIARSTLRRKIIFYEG